MNLQQSSLQNDFIEVTASYPDTVLTVDPILPNKLSGSIDLSRVKQKGALNGCFNKTRVYGIGLESYEIMRQFNTADPADPPNGFTGTYAPLALRSVQLCPQGTRYITLLPNDSGIGLGGAYQYLLEDLPDRAEFQLGIPSLNVEEQFLYNSNSENMNPSIAGGLLWESQFLQHIIVRFRIVYLDKIMK